MASCRDSFTYRETKNEKTEGKEKRKDIMKETVG
jgi:hypothetical protein